uniref:Uncharacterized protein n=1 Tax=Romanomermis culicivorax TaxID=13658 RepID=A0A915JMA1_ROMCU
MVHLTLNERQVTMRHLGTVEQRGKSKNPTIFMHSKKIRLIICANFFLVVGDYTWENVAEGDADDDPNFCFIGEISRCVTKKIQIHGEKRTPNSYYEACRNTCKEKIRVKCGLITRSGFGCINEH